MPKGIKGFQKGQKFTPEHRAKLSAATTRNRTGKRHSEKTKEKLSEAKKGENNPMWKGGITPENKRLRQSATFRRWREAVFMRDNWTCQICGIRGGVKLHPHHIKEFAIYPELRFDVDNGITLCADCHSKIHGQKLIA
jgi:predicted restriction endonuclease